MAIASFLDAEALGIDLALVDNPAIHFKTAAQFKQALHVAY